MDSNRTRLDQLLERLERGETRDHAGNEFDILKRLGGLFPRLLESGAAAGEAGDDVFVSQHQAVSAPHRSRRLVFSSVLGGFGLAAALLVGVFLDSFFSGAARSAKEGSRCEIVLASLTPVADAQLRGADAGAPESAFEGVTATTGGSFAIAPESSYGVVIQSPRAGWARIVVLESEHPRTYPKPNQRPIPIEAKRPFRFHPLVAPSSSTPVLAIVTDRDATRLIDDAASSLPPGLKDPVVFIDRIQDALGKSGYTWAAIGQVVVEPAEPTPR